MRGWQATVLLIVIMAGCLTTPTDTNANRYESINVTDIQLLAHENSTSVKITYRAALYCQGTPPDRYKTIVIVYNDTDEVAYGYEDLSVPRNGSETIEPRLKKEYRCEEPAQLNTTEPNVMVKLTSNFTRGQPKCPEITNPEPGTPTIATVFWKNYTSNGETQVKRVNVAEETGSRAES